MKLIPGLAWFASFKNSRPRPRRRPEQDHGDMGTAFGLDAIQSLFQEPQREVRSMPLPPHPWEYRLIRRSGL
jgi:hypothetical protein